MYLRRDEVTTSQFRILHHKNSLSFLIICLVRIKLKNMKTNVIIIISVISCFMIEIAIAQISNDVELKGIVLDANTETPLSYAHISISNTTAGTITNENGKFILVFNKALMNR